MITTIKEWKYSKLFNSLNENIKMNNFEYRLNQGENKEPIIINAPFLIERKSRFMYNNDIYEVDLVTEYHYVHCIKILDDFKFSFD